MKYTKEYLEILVSESKCMWDVVEKSGMSKQAGNYRYLKNKISHYNISTDHFENQRIGKYKPLRELSDILVKGKFLTLNGNRLKKRLFEAGLKKNKCEFCDQDENWRGKRMSLILDHIDGDRDNNELENLRILCPNCNATLDTHCAKNKK